MKYKVLDLFSGIGGFSLGLERTGGFETVAFCEIEPYCRKVLKKHWPEVPCYEDIRTLTSEQLSRDGIRPNIITGGFPCQDISTNGIQRGIGAERSGLWKEMARLVSEIRPNYVIVENVAALLSGDSGRWFGTVLRDLAALRFDAEWHCIPASAIGAPHRRDRVWIVAYAASLRAEKNLEGLYSHGLKSELRRAARRDGIFGMDNPRVCRMDDGVSINVDGHFALGNTVVPQIPEAIGNAIIEYESKHAGPNL